MIHAHINKRSAVPWWAAFGAPLIGVPLLIALIALASPDKGTVTEPETGAKVEQMEVQSVDSPVELPPEYKERVESRC